MPSLFMTPPPRFSKQEVSALLQSDFNIEGNISELYSDRDQVFIISQPNEDLILKISNPAEKRSILELQDAAADHIMKNDPEIRVPRTRGEIIQCERKGIRFFVRLINHVRGDLFSDRDPKKSDYEKIGNFLGRFSTALNGFFHDAAIRKDFDWDAGNISHVSERLSLLSSKSDIETVSHFLNNASRFMDQLKTDLRTCVIHNDGNEHNILVNNNKKAIGIIDFGDMIHSYQALEPAVCMAYIAMSSTDPLESILAFTRGYHSCFELNESEIRSMVYLMTIRLSITVIMASWRKKLFPENKYLTISEKPAWVLLRKLKKSDLAFWEDALVHSMRN
ncbi:MAG: hypothetical protein CMG60_08855 [Candidatus Marinimicrobia bacterium]|nr:hypothetical protein [Candidatus Neomarinimicrobiota bacterium]